jgi:hypothetical protein
MHKPIAGYASPHSDRLQDPKCDSNDNHHIQNRFDAAEAEDASDPTKRICRSRGGASSARKIVDPPAARAHRRCLEHDVKTEVTLAHQLRQVRRREARKEAKRFVAIERAQVEAAKEASSVGNANTTRANRPVRIARNPADDSTAATSPRHVEECPA